MGIDNGAELIFGWKVRTKKVMKWLKVTGQESLSEVPKDIYLLETYPYNDCREGDQVYAVSLITPYDTKPMSLTELNNLGTAERIAIAKNFIKNTLNDKCSTSEPRIFALANIH